MQQTIGSFQIEAGADGVALVVFSRPPVNAVSISVYEDIGRLVDELSADTAVRAVVLTAPEESRAWCGGADLKDFVGMNPAQGALPVHQCPAAEVLRAGSAGRCCDQRRRHRHRHGVVRALRRAHCRRGCALRVSRNRLWPGWRRGGAVCMAEAPRGEVSRNPLHRPQIHGAPARADRVLQLRPAARRGARPFYGPRALDRGEEPAVDPSEEACLDRP